MKKGDFMFWKTPAGDWISIFDHIDRDGWIQAILSIGLPEKKFYTKPEEYQEYGTYPLTNISEVRECRFATPGEQNTLLDALDKAGFRYNSSTMKLESKIEFRHGELVQATDMFGDEWLIVFDKKDDSTGAIHSIVAWDTRSGYFDTDIQNQGKTFCQNPKSELRSCRPGTSKDWGMLNAELKKRNLRWDAEEGILQPIPILEPFEKVLVRDDGGKWRGHIFTEYHPGKTFPYEVVGGTMYRCCIPYKGNEHLLGTTNPAY